MRWLSGDLLDPGLPLDPAGYDVVTALSSLHHLPLRPEITAAARDLIPGARLRRRFFWRYSLLWHRPMPSQKASELPVTPV
ncbi:MAG: hypothetical protein ACRDRJ_47700 [Streptosporangiaceae bacterium]